MGNKQYFKSKIFSIANASDFNHLSLQLFQYQSKENQVYADYLEALNVDREKVLDISEIPFLPISFFKSHQVMSGSFLPQQVFSSSGTTGGLTSKHFVDDIALYEASCKIGFESVYNPISDYCVLALLPSYLERTGSSLIYMAERMIEQSEDNDSGFYLDNIEELDAILRKKIRDKTKTLLLGVSFALLDFAERFQLPTNNIMVMETGGMKGRRKEMIRQELHHILCSRFGVDVIHSEYGMTELMSQAYSRGEGRFSPPKWVKVLVRETDDPFSYAKPGKTGGINIIDLANVDSCAFIETQDLGRRYEDGTFEVMGRFDNADIRGCNLMVI